MDKLIVDDADNVDQKVCDQKRREFVRNASVVAIGGAITTLFPIL